MHILAPKGRVAKLDKSFNWTERKIHFQNWPHKASVKQQENESYILKHMIEEILIESL
jgi:hypothetical protein